jgi:hypothetical protein
MRFAPLVRRDEPFAKRIAVWPIATRHRLVNNGERLCTQRLGLNPETRPAIIFC